MTDVQHSAELPEVLPHSVSRAELHPCFTRCALGVLRWVRERAVVEQLDGDPGVAVPMPPVEQGVIY
jgi:hypothetical protein